MPVEAEALGLAHPLAGVELNRAIAVAEVEGPQAALELTPTEPERRFLEGRMAELRPRSVIE